MKSSRSLTKEVQKNLGVGYALGNHFNKSFRLGLAVLLLFLWGCSEPNNQAAQGKDSGVGAKLVQGACSSCHKFSGQPESKFNLKAPDLMWGGEKYQSAWLERWLEGQEEHLYPNGYRWDQGGGPDKHMAVSKEEAVAIADYFEAHLLDERIKKNAIDLSQFTEQERDFGAEIFKQFSCLGCHQIKEDGKTIGGPISANIVRLGEPLQRRLAVPLRVESAGLHPAQRRIPGGFEWLGSSLHRRIPDDAGS